MNLYILVDALEDIRDSSSRNEKEEILADILESPNATAFRDLCAFIYNPYRRLNVKVTSSILDRADHVSSVPTNTHDMIWDLFLQTLELLESGSISGNDARDQIVDVLSLLDYDLAEWFALFFNKKLKIGVGRSTIEKLIPDVAPKFSVQLCKKYKQQPLVRLYMVQPKVNGLRGIVGCFDGTWQALSRNGRPLYNVDHILKDAERLSNILSGDSTTSFVFDGEFYAGSWEDSMSILKRSKRGHSNSSSLRYHVFDVIPLHQWVRGACDKVLYERDAILNGAVSVLKSSNILYLPCELSQDHEEIVKITSRYVREGWEGSVLKDPRSFYNYDRDDTWIKFKFFEEEDVHIVGVKLGYHNSSTGNIIDDEDPQASSLNPAWSPVVRSLIIDHDGVETSVGSGLELSQRYEFYSLHQKGGLVGRVAEVEYQEVTPDGKLLFPRFKRLRDDKT